MCNHSKAFTGRARLQGQDRKSWVKAFDATGGEEQGVDAGHSVEVWKSWKSGRGYFCSDILYFYGSPSSLKTKNIYRM